jgi:lipoyl(octanoyl) transferase
MNASFDPLLQPAVTDLTDRDVANVGIVGNVHRPGEPLPSAPMQSSPSGGEAATNVPPLLRFFGRVDYEPTWRAMQSFTEQRDENTRDEIWLLEHPPVFTLGMNGKAEHVLAAGDIPVVNIDRGGQVTYHGPGQLVAYPLLDLRRLKLGVRELVVALENAIIATVAQWGIHAQSKRDAPGVYVDGKKLASIGLRIKRGCSYHGVALNVAMDLSPFKRINPCGYRGLEVTQMSQLGGPKDVQSVADVLGANLVRILSGP